MSEPHEFQDHFSGVAASYAASRPAYPPELYAFVARSAPATQRAWDCATGNGQAAVGLSEYFDEVHGTDASPQQIENAMPRPNISYSVQLSENTVFADDHFDAVTIAQALHWFDLDKFASELSRVLRPAGVTVAWTYGFFNVEERIDEIVRAYFFEPIEPFWPEESELAWSGYSGLELPFAPIDTPEFDLTFRWNLTELIGYLSTWSALNRYIEQHGSGLIGQLTERMAAVWVDPDQKRTIDMDFYVRAWRNV